MNKRTYRPTREAIPSSAPRGGVTLVEVLMSLLVVGIGLVSVAVLFPLSILRTIEATQLTSATMARYNAEQMIDALPGIWGNPDGNTNAIEHAGQNYIVDPYGYDVLTSQWMTSTGNAAPGAGPSPIPFASLLDRFPGAVNNVMIPDLTTPNPSAAAGFVTLPDSWDTLLDETGSIPTNYAAATPSIDLPGASAAIGLTADYASGANQPVYRVIMFDVTGDFSHARTLTGITVATDTLTWNDALPTGFTPATAWLQVQQRHYSWLLTVRRQSTNVLTAGPPVVSDESAEIDVVVFFNRAPENAKPMTTPLGAADPLQLAENIYPLLEPGFRIGVSSVRLDWGTNPEPFLKEGKFIFDPENARWYRILKITYETATRVRLDLDRGADGNSTLSENAGQQGVGVFLSGIVDVYPIKSKTARFTSP